VACIEEAMELRESGITDPIALLEGVFEPAELTLAAEQGLMIGLHSHRQLGWLLAAKLPRPLSVWLKIDTGMHRLGFAPEEFARVHAQLNDSANVRDLVLMTHFARADEPDSEATNLQLARFRDLPGGDRMPRSLANSAAVMAWPQTHGDWIRPGIMLYGCSPLPDEDNHPDLAPVMRLESELIAIHDLAAGESIGYGGRFTCETPTRVGVVATGYADGYPRHAPDGTPLAVDGQPTRLIGRVSMDMLTVDLTGLPDADIGTRVQLWGDRISANTVARHCDTIAYELLTHVTRRVHFRYT
jgi:alanine racemase